MPPGVVLARVQDSAYHHGIFGFSCGPEIGNLIRSQLVTRYGPGAAHVHVAGACRQAHARLRSAGCARLRQVMLDGRLRHGIDLNDVVRGDRECLVAIDIQAPPHGTDIFREDLGDLLGDHVVGPHARLLDEEDVVAQLPEHDTGLGYYGVLGMVGQVDQHGLPGPP